MIFGWKTLLRRAEKQLDDARAACTAGKPAWAWLAAHGAAESALKALRLRYAMNGRERILSRLLLDLPPHCRPSPHLLDRAARLDSRLVPTRADPVVPDPDRLTPDPELAIAIATEILDYCRLELARKESGRFVLRLRVEG